ncbi:PRC-barrel domain-containing protein [Streptomyces sp. NPDC000983]|uniref:PRC-barrel domain-containing protein n=1 Tax=Streptomyces sp. NPDC000983 TaxID=3154373 RepID=UPI00332B611C
MRENSWDYQPSAGYGGADLTGFKVEAVGGDIGKVDKHNSEVGAACLVVDTGPWIFGKEVLIPARAVTQIDIEEEKVYLSLTKEQVKEAPEFHRESHYDSQDYREQVSTHYWPQHV